MNLVKSIFITIAPLILLYIVIQTSFEMIRHFNGLIQIGVLLSALPLLLFFAYLFLFKNIARTHVHLPWISVPSFVGYCLVLFVFIQTSDIQLINSMVYSLAAFFISFLYIYWYSNNRRKNAKSLALNSYLPEFYIKDYEGNQLNSSQFIGNKTLVFFYRGNWCPFCVAQIEEIVTIYKKFNEQGVKVVFISPQSEKRTKTLAKKYNLAFKFYTDENNLAAKQLGIDHKFGLPIGFQTLGYETDSVHPTVIATDEQGVILYSDQTSNYRVRPKPQELLEIFI